MKALSLIAPWSVLVSNGLKTIENRSQSTSHRGIFLIHASKRVSEAEYWRARQLASTIHGTKKAGQCVPDFEALERGGFVGVASLVGVVHPNEDRLRYPTHFDHRWHQSGCYGLLIMYAQPLPFFPYRGALGLFDVPADTARRALAGLNPKSINHIP